MIPNRAIAAAILLLACTTIACDKKESQTGVAPMKIDGAVSWYGGYTMPTLLAQPLQPANVEDLADISRRRWYAEFHVHTDSAPKNVITISSCDAYLAHSSKNLRTVRERDNAPFMEVALMCKATQLIMAAGKFERSYLQPVEFNENLPQVLPAKFAMVLSVSEQARLNADASIKYWRDVNSITKVEPLGSYHAIYRHAAGSQELAVVARGDFNGDKIEDMLITSRDSVSDGSYGALRLFLITRESNSKDVVILNEYKAFAD